MKKEWILVVDSGSGGLWTLNKIRKLLPNENYLFFMDKLHCPYGNKSQIFLKKLSYNYISKLISIFKIKVIVLACNTLSCVAYEYLTSKIKNIPIVKIDPYIDKNYFDNKKTLILATKNTIKHSKLLKMCKDKKNIYMFGFANLAKKIDSSKDNYAKLQNFITKKLKPFANCNIENVVLGCTHFNYIKSQIETALSKKIIFFESSEYVAKQVKNLICQKKNTQKTHRKSKCNSLHKKQIGNFLTLYKI